MYVSVFGSSNITKHLLKMRQSNGNPLHTKETIIENSDLHAPGIERGVNPYGG